MCGGGGRGLESKRGRRRGAFSPHGPVFSFTPPPVSPSCPLLLSVLVLIGLRVVDSDRRHGVHQRKFCLWVQMKLSLQLRLWVALPVHFLGGTADAEIGPFCREPSAGEGILDRPSQNTFCPTSNLELRITCLALKRHVFCFCFLPMKNNLFIVQPINMREYSFACFPC